MLLVLFLTTALLAHAARVWPVQSVSTLTDAVQRAEAGDSIELESGDYTIDSALFITRPLTLRSRDRLARAVLRSSARDALLMVVSSSRVVISDLIIGAQANGVSDERSLDIYIGAGTQLEPIGENNYNGIAVNERRRSTIPLPSRAEIAVARQFQINNSAALRKRSEIATELRALDDLVIRNVDFSASRAATNVAFARGAYSSARIERCTFGRVSAAHINALVGVADARFDKLIVRNNTFAGAAHVLFGSTDLDIDQSIGLNYWPSTLANKQTHEPLVYLGGLQQVPTTYCLDAQCTLLAPIVDGDAPTHAFASLQAAFAAGVRRVMLTDDVTVSAPATVSAPNTVIEGTRDDKAPLITIVSGGAIISKNGALVGMRNVRLALVGANVAAIVYTDGATQTLPAAPFAQDLLKAADVQTAETTVVLYDGVSFMGDDSVGQVAVIISAPRVRVELEDSVVVQCELAVLVHRGTLVLLDATVFGAKRAAIYVETATHQSGLRVSSSTFIGCGIAIETGGFGGVSAVQELYISCSQFLFNVQRDPIVSHECVTKPTLCSAVLRYNSIISDHSDAASAQTTAGNALRRLLHQGNNHLENGRVRTDYVYFGTPTHFQFEDDQGRFDGVSAVLMGPEPAAFILASYAPMVDQCFSIDSLGAHASVVSDVIEFRSDKLLHTDDSISVRFRTKDGSFAKTPLAIYTVAHLGSPKVLWTRAPASTLRPERYHWVLDATLSSRDASLDKHAHRALVVALATPADDAAKSLNEGVATSTIAPRAIAKRLCVVCNAQLPPRLLDQFCDGNSDNIRGSFDAAYEELAFGRRNGAPRQQSASLYIYGQCTTAQCSVALDHNENIEGTSSSVRGELRSTATDCSEKQSAFIDFLPRASPQSSVRNLLVESAASVECTIGVQPSAIASGPVVAFNTIRGALCIDGRAGGLYVNNDIASTTLAIYIGGAFEARAPAAIVVEANVISSGDIVIDGPETAAAQQAMVIERATFVASGAGVRIFGNKLEVSVARCKNIGRLIADSASKAVVVATENVWATGAQIVLRAQSLVTGGSAPAATRFELYDQARLVALTINSESTVSIKDANAAVTLRDVKFANLAASLQCTYANQLCAEFELSVAGVDLQRSAIFDLSGKQLLLPVDVQAAGAANAYWALDGHVNHCSGADVVRTSAYCGCEQPALANAIVDEPATKKKAISQQQSKDRAAPSAAINNAAANAKNAAASKVASPKDSPKSKSMFAKKVVAQPLDDDSDDDSNSTLYVFWWIFGVAVLICLLFLICACVYRARRVSNTGIVVQNAQAYRGESNQNEVVIGRSRLDAFHINEDQPLVRQRPLAKFGNSKSE